MSEPQPRRAAYDLHLHTAWSYDASAPVDGYFALARQLGIRCLTITDHHVLDSLAEVVAAARVHPEIAAIPSAELSVTTHIGAVDLLCYGLPLVPPPSLRQVLEEYHAWQRATGEAISRGMLALGHDFDDPQRLALLRSYRPERAIALQGNTHVKNERLRSHFVERGFIASAEEYPGLLQRLREKVDFPPYPAVDRVVVAVLDAGGVVAIAHPHGYFAQGDEARMDALRRECRFAGIECAHPTVPAEFTLRYRAYCERHGLFSTGGSDCHEPADVSAKLATHGGPEEWLEEFLARIGDRAIR